MFFNQGMAWNGNTFKEVSEQKKIALYATWDLTRKYYTCCPRCNYVIRFASPLKPLNTLVMYVIWSEGFQGCPQLTPMMPRDGSLSHSYTSDHCCFSILCLGLDVYYQEYLIYLEFSLSLRS